MKLKNIFWMLFLLAIAASAVSCGGNSGSSSAFVKLQGAGASFPSPLYLKWFKTYSDAHQNVQVDYQSVGSGSGVKSFMDRTVDFAASDAAMKPDDIAKVDGGVQLLPMTAGSIVLAYNLKEAPSLKLTREGYAGIFSGKVTKWTVNGDSSRLSDPAYRTVLQHALNAVNNPSCQPLRFPPGKYWPRVTIVFDPKSFM